MAHRSPIDTEGKRTALTPSLDMRELASADVGAMQAKLQLVQVRIRETQKRQADAAQAGDTEEANKQKDILNRQVSAYQRGREFVQRVEYAKRSVAAAQAQPYDSMLNPGTSQHPTPTVSATPQATPPMNAHSTPRLTTPRKTGDASEPESDVEHESVATKY
jgi:hypothetical protein